MRAVRGRRRLPLAGVLAAFAGGLAASLPSPLAAQEPGAGGPPPLSVLRGEARAELPVTSRRGFAALPASRLGEALGWPVSSAPAGAVLTGPEGVRVTVRDGTPFLSWGRTLVQLADAPYFDAGELYVPAQFVTEVIPSLLPRAYRFSRGVLAVIAPLPERRVVVIDAGHGGEDPGTVSRSGVREKVVALGIAQAMARALRDVPGVEVHMLRETDVLVPIWDRGAKATELKGERPGVLVSIHANSAGPGNTSARGFETYFLSEARTEHERRVAAIENAPLGVEAPPEAAGGDLDFILRELKNLDQQHWSSLMAELVQQEVARIHPGPDRGVKQAPLAVITNAIMPAVLVEIGYLSHPEEARLLARPAFQEEAGQALARAVTRFFQRYPPGSGGAGGAGR